MRKNIETELNRVVNEGIVTQINPNVKPVERATPTVNVLNQNGQIRICGDYRITINPVLLKHTYPVPLFDQLRQTSQRRQIYKILLERRLLTIRDSTRIEEVLNHNYTKRHNYTK